MNDKTASKFLPIICAILFGFFTGTATATATVYYLDATNGDNSWSGTKMEYQGGAQGPWKSLSKLETIGAGVGFQPGDQILLKRGEIFSSAFSVSINSSGDPLTLQYIEISAYGNGAKPVLQFSGLPVTNSIPNNRVWTDLGLNQDTIWFYNYTGPAVTGLWRDGIFLKYASDQTLADGDFYWDKTNGIYYRSPDNSPNDDNLFRGGTGYGFHVSGLSYLKFSNLHFNAGTGIGGAATTTDPIHHLTIEDCEFSNIGTPIFLTSEYDQENHDITIENNTFTQNGRGIMILANNGEEKNMRIIIRGNQLMDIDANGYHELFVESTGGTVDIETISIQNANDSIITDNEISNGASEGGIIIWTQPSSTSNNNVIARNIIHDIIGAGINLFGSNTLDANVNNLVYNNLIYNCSDTGGIRLSAKDSDDSNFIYNNTIVNCGNSFYINGLVSGFNIFNNISLNPTSSHIQYNNSTFLSHMDTNIYFPDAADAFRTSNDDKTLAQWKTDIGQDLNSISIDPLLADINTADFHLTASSPAIDAADSSALPAPRTTDIENNPILSLMKPDIGAYEFGHNDSDGDGVIDYDEICYDGDCQNYNPYDSATNPSGGDLNLLSTDTDGDSYSDSAEISAGTNPISAASIPTVSAPAMGFTALLLLLLGLAGVGLRFSRITFR